MTQPIQTIYAEKAFLKAHGTVLKEFLAKFSNPLKATPERFVWDHWNVEGQYRHLRTPFHGFFKTETEKKILQALGEFGRTHLGCQHISEPWISVYMDGHFQNIHTDPAHGPYAFVWTLQASPASGGHTHIARENLFSISQQAQEQQQFFTRLESKNNLFTVFDPRLPHFVEPVRGAFDFPTARIVIHGWFTDPRGSVEGPLGDAKNIHQQIDQLAQEISGLFTANAAGYLALKFKVHPSGRIQSTQILASSLRDQNNQEAQQLIPVSVLKKRLNGLRHSFSKKSSSSVLTLPLSFG